MNNAASLSLKFYPSTPPSFSSLRGQDFFLFDVCFDSQCGSLTAPFGFVLAQGKIVE